MVQILQTAQLEWLKLGTPGKVRKGQKSSENERTGGKDRGKARGRGRKKGQKEEGVDERPPLDFWNMNTQLLTYIGC